MPFNLLLLPLLGGFCFIRFFNLTRYPTSRLSGQRLLFWAAIAGVFLVILSRTCVILLLHYIPEVGLWWGMVSPLPLSGTAFGAFFIGGVAGYTANHLISKKTALSWTIERYGSLVEILFAESFENNNQIQVTLANGKVYVGYIIWQPLEPHKDNSYIGILPTLSGYRDTKSKQVMFTTNYAPTYENPGDFDVNNVIKYFPMSEISIASVFDPDVYDKWK